MAEAKKTIKKSVKEELDNGIDQKDNQVAAQADKKIRKVVTKTAATETAIDTKATAKASQPADTSSETLVKEEALAKAGKRSAKAKKEAEAKEVKEDRKEKIAKGEVDPSELKKGPAPKTRTRLQRRSKKYQKAAELIDSTKTYSLSEATELLPKTSTVKFDASVEIHVNLGVDPRQADQNIRATVALPHGTGKSLRVAVFAPADQHEAAKKAGADIVGEDELLQQLDKEQLDFDVLIATPQLMAKLGKYARTLGPKGLMPNPKSGTVTAKVADAVKQAKAGKVEFRVDKQGIIHQAIGKASFTPAQLAANAEAVLKVINDAKPGSVKGAYLQKVSLTTTMGPSVTISLG